MTDDIIDLGEYARRKETGEEPSDTVFAIWGGEGERSRFALPLWRASYLVGGSLAALVWEPAGEAPERLDPLMILDLAVDPARTEVAGVHVAAIRDAEAAPAMVMDEERASIYLGERDGRRWYLVITDLGRESSRPPPEEIEDVRADLYFLSGECAGLLFHRDFDTDAGHLE